MQRLTRKDFLMPKLKVLFLCTGNSCRSQMAEGWARALKGDQIEAYSAGVEPHGMNARAMQVMKEAGVDISNQSSKHVDTLSNVQLDYVVTVCGHANETCPVFPGKAPRIIHVGFDDPPALAKGAASNEEALNHYRRVRDEIKAWVQTLPESLSRTREPAPRDKTKTGVLVMCSGNTCRSQMAEGLLRKVAGDVLDVHSAGVEPGESIHPMAVEVMREIGIDITRQWPKSTRAYLGRAWFKYVITVCPEAERQCPRVFLGAMNRLFWPVEDPSRLPDADGQLAAFRRARDVLAKQVQEWVATMRAPAGTV
jgi:arsenate reductase